MAKNFMWCVLILGLSAHSKPEEKTKDASGSGNGGDVVLCAKSEDPKLKFEGYYSFDYLVTYNNRTKNAEIVDVKSWEESRDRIKKIIYDKIPIWIESYDSFAGDVDNSSDFSRKHVWVSGPAGLVNIEDERLVRLLPENCLREIEKMVDGVLVKIKVPNLFQAVIRRKTRLDGVTIYEHNQEIIDELRKNRPLQFSFVMMHEWGWEHGLDLLPNQEFNRLVHSTCFEDEAREGCPAPGRMSRDTVLKSLINLNLLTNETLEKYHFSLGTQLSEATYLGRKDLYAELIRRGANPFVGALILTAELCKQNPKVCEDLRNSDYYKSSRNISDGAFSVAAVMEDLESLKLFYDWLQGGKLSQEYLDKALLRSLKDKKYISAQFLKSRGAEVNFEKDLFFKYGEKDSNNLTFLHTLNTDDIEDLKKCGFKWEAKIVYKILDHLFTYSISERALVLINILEEGGADFKDPELNKIISQHAGVYDGTHYHNGFLFFSGSNKHYFKEADVLTWLALKRKFELLDYFLKNQILDPNEKYIVYAETEGGLFQSKVKYKIEASLLSIIEDQYSEASHGLREEVNKILRIIQKHGGKHFWEHIPSSVRDADEVP